MTVHLYLGCHPLCPSVSLLVCQSVFQSFRWWVCPLVHINQSISRVNFFTKTYKKFLWKSYMARSQFFTLTTCLKSEDCNSFSFSVHSLQLKNVLCFSHQLIFYLHSTQVEKSFVNLKVRLFFINFHFWIFISWFWVPLRLWFWSMIKIRKVRKTHSWVSYCYNWFPHYF